MLRWFKRLMLGLVALVVMLVTGSFVSNLLPPTRSSSVDHLNGGMAQAFLLDRLMPDWAQDYAAPETTLEGLLRRAVSQPAATGQ